MNGAFVAYAGGRAKRRVVPCPTTAAGIGAVVGAGPGAAGAAGDVCRRVTGMAAPWIGVVCDGFAATCDGAPVLSAKPPCRRRDGTLVGRRVQSQCTKFARRVGEADVVAGCVVESRL